MKTRKWLLIGLLGTLGNPSVYAQHEVGNGGNILDVNGTPRLFDLVVKSKCRLLRGTEMYKTIPDLDEALKKVAAVDWYLALSLKNEIQKMTYCLTGDLRKIDPGFWNFKVHPENRNSPVKGDEVQFKLAKQVAVRMGDWVYADEDKILSLPVKYDSAKLMFHEAFHAYLPMDLPDWKRKLAIWTIVGKISDIVDGLPVSQSELHYYMDTLGVQFPLTVEQLTPYRQQVEYLLSSAEAREGILLNEKSPEILAEVDVNEINSYLAPEHEQVQTAITTLQNDIRKIMMDGNLDEFSNIIGKEYHRLNILTLAFSSFDQLNKTKQKQLVTSQAFARAIHSIYRQIDAMKFKQGDFAILAEPEFQEFGASPPKTESLALTSIKPRRWTNNWETNLPPSLAALSQMIQALYRTGEFDQLKALITEKEDFYQSLGLKALKVQLTQMNYFFPAEKDLASQVLSQVRDGAVEAFIETTLKPFRPEQRAELKALIHVERFKN